MGTYNKPLVPTNTGEAAVSAEQAAALGLMSVSDLGQRELLAIRKAMEFWVANWDWECPTLFGLRKDELNQVVAAWPTCEGIDRETCASAVVGSLRELLHGASAVKLERVPNICGLTYEEMKQLLSVVLELCMKPGFSERLDGFEL